MNNIVELSNNSQITPNDNELKIHIQKLINNGTKYDTLNPDWKIDIIGGQDKIKHIIKSSQYGRMNKSKLSRHKKYIANIEYLIKNSVYTNNPEPNKKPHKKPNVAIYHYFEVKVKIKNKLYKVTIHTEQYKNESAKNLKQYIYMM